MRALTWSALGIPLRTLFSRFYITNAFTGSGIHRFFPSIAGCSIVTIRVVAGAVATWLKVKRDGSEEADAFRFAMKADRQRPTLEPSPAIAGWG